jgi:hypothetical protein
MIYAGDATNYGAIAGLRTDRAASLAASALYTLTWERRAHPLTT